MRLIYLETTVLFPNLFAEYFTHLSLSVSVQFISIPLQTVPFSLSHHKTHFLSVFFFFIPPRPDLSCHFFPPSRSFFSVP